MRKWWRTMDRRAMVRLPAMSSGRRFIMATTGTGPTTAMAGVGDIAAGDAAGNRHSYFRTQITRTTDALASVDVPLVFTPLAVRKSRTASARSSIPCAAGVAFDGPATTVGFNNA